VIRWLGAVRLAGAWPTYGVVLSGFQTPEWVGPVRLSGHA